MAAVSEIEGVIATHEVRTFGEVRSGYTHFAENDVLWAKITPCMENGKSAVASGMLNGIGCGTTEFFVLRSRGAVLPGFLHRYLRQQSFRKRARATMQSGVGQARVPKEFIAEATIGVPPLAEQERILVRLEQLQSRSRAVRKMLEVIPSTLEQFRQSALAAAFRGDLTADWRALNECAGWVRTDIQSIGIVGTGSTPLRSEAGYYSPDGTPWVTSAATALPIVMEATEFVTDEAIAAHRLKTYPVGTLLVAMYGEGKTRGQVTELGITATINQACAAIVVNDAIADKDFVRFALQANYLHMRSLAEGGAQPNLNLAKIKAVSINLPSVSEQREIVRRLKALLARAGSLANRTAELIDHLKFIDQSILAKAFRGELVPQDPNDEPASVLLERIRAEREAAGGAKRRGRKGAAR
jgi:type I restriction enzyme S subunit